MISGVGSPQSIPDTIKKIPPVLIVVENLSSRDPANDDVMQSPREIYAYFSWHIVLIENKIPSQV